jgi:hypothetical protein
MRAETSVGRRFWGSSSASCCLPVHMHLWREQSTRARRDLNFEAEMVVTVCRQLAPCSVALFLTSRYPASLPPPALREFAVKAWPTWGSLCPRRCQYRSRAWRVDRDRGDASGSLMCPHCAIARGRAHHRFGDRPSWPPSMRSALEDPSQVGPGPGSSYSARIHIHTRAPRAGGRG